LSQFLFIPSPPSFKRILFLFCFFSSSTLSVAVAVLTGFAGSSHLIDDSHLERTSPKAAGLWGQCEGSASRQFIV